MKRRPARSAVFAVVASRHAFILRTCLLLLLLWEVGACVHATPDFIPYFNELAALRSNPILVDSDLDWGQDLERLVRTLQSKDANHVWIDYNGSADLDRFDLPADRFLEVGRQIEL